MNCSNCGFAWGPYAQFKWLLLFSIAQREEKLCGGSRILLRVTVCTNRSIHTLFTQIYQYCRYTTVAASPYNKPAMILCDWKQNLCCYLDIFKEEGFVYFSIGISDISKMIQSCFGTLEAPRLQQKVGVKRRFLAEYVWKKLCWASRDAALKQFSTLLVANGPSFWNNMFPGLRAREVLPLHAFEVHSCFLTSCHRATSAASRLLSHTRRLLLLLRACSTMENVCTSWMTASLHPYSHRARWGQSNASVLQLPLYLFNKKKWKCD